MTVYDAINNSTISRNDKDKALIDILDGGRITADLEWGFTPSITPDWGGGGGGSNGGNSGWEDGGEILDPNDNGIPGGGVTNGEGQGSSDPINPFTPKKGEEKTAPNKLILIAAVAIGIYSIIK